MLRFIKTTSLLFHPKPSLTSQALTTTKVLQRSHFPSTTSLAPASRSFSTTAKSWDSSYFTLDFEPLLLYIDPESWLESIMTGIPQKNYEKPAKELFPDVSDQGFMGKKEPWLHNESEMYEKLPGPLEGFFAPDGVYFEEYSELL